MGGSVEIVPPVASPCIQICEIDERGLCVGCARTLDEIARWGSATPEWRAAVIAALSGRRGLLPSSISTDSDSPANTS